MSEDRVKRLGDGWLFLCPGCGENHRPTDAWQFNGDTVHPTFRPSILVTMPGTARRCHSFVTNGRIEFLSDCTHELAGQTVDLPPCPYCQDDED